MTTNKMTTLAVLIDNCRRSPENRRAFVNFVVAHMHEFEIVDWRMFFGGIRDLTTNDLREEIDMHNRIASHCRSYVVFNETTTATDCLCYQSKIKEIIEKQG